MAGIESPKDIGTPTIKHTNNHPRLNKQTHAHKHTPSLPPSFPPSFLSSFPLSRTSAHAMATRILTRLSTIVCSAFIAVNDEYVTADQNITREAPTAATPHLLTAYIDWLVGWQSKKETTLPSSHPSAVDRGPARRVERKPNKSGFSSCARFGGYHRVWKYGCGRGEGGRGGFRCQAG